MHWMEVGGQLHARAALRPVERYSGDWVDLGAGPDAVK
jgi:hypothetical protein